MPSRKAVWTLAAVLWLLPAAGSAHGRRHAGKTDRLLSGVSSLGKRQRVIIRTKPGAQGKVARNLERRGEKIDKVHRLVSAVSARVSPHRFAELAADPDVESISVDAVVTAHSGGGKGSRKRSTTTTTTGPTVQQLVGVSGWFSTSNTVVAIVDSGIAPVSDFEGRIAGFYDFTVGEGAVATAPNDEYGHGTHVAGLIGSNGRSSSGAYVGVAPGVKFLGLKVLDKNGVGRTSNVLSALEFAVANKDQFNLKVINLSLGHPIYESAATDPLVQAVEAAVRAGLMVVVSAGNYGANAETGVTGYAGITSPGNAPSAITVGAAITNRTIVRTDDRVADYSSRGPSWYDGVAKPDVVAPGHWLISNTTDSCTLATMYPWLVVQSGSSKYLKLNGSSMAAAVVSGVVALMLDANAYASWARWNAIEGPKPDYVPAPSLTANAVKAMLQYTATPLVDGSGVPYDALTQGTGLVNGVGAATLAYLTDTTQPAGTYWATATVPPVSKFDHVDTMWSQALIWGTRMVAGSSLVELNQSAFEENIVWGTGEYDMVWGTPGEDENIVWGTNLAGFDVTWTGNVTLDENIVWGTFGDWDENIVWGTNLLGYFDGFNIVWGTCDGGESIMWGTLDDENIVWGTSEKKVTVLGSGGAL